MKILRNSTQYSVEFELSNLSLFLIIELVFAAIIKKISD